MKSVILLAVFTLLFSCGKSGSEKSSEKIKKSQVNKSVLPKKLIKVGKLKAINKKLQDRKKTYKNINPQFVFGDLGKGRGDAYERAVLVLKYNMDKSIPLLIKHINDPNPMIRAQSLRMLGDFSSKRKIDVNILLKQYEKEEMSKVKSMIIDTINKIGVYSEAVEKLAVRELKAKSPLIRWQAAKLLGKLGKKCIKSKPALKKLVSDKENWIRLTAAFSIWQIDSKDIEGFKSISKDINDKDRNFRKKFIKILGKITNHNDVIVPILIKALKDKALPLRRIAAISLSKLGSGAKAALNSLREAEKSKDYSLRVWAKKAIQSIEGKTDVKKEK